jgi:hypothetical protein
MEPVDTRRGSPLKVVMLGCGVVLLVGVVLMCGGLVWIASGPEGGVRLSNEMEPYATHKDGKSTAVPLQDITDIRHRSEGLIGDVIEIQSQSGVPMKIEIAPLNQGETFLNALRDAWERSK